MTNRQTTAANSSSEEHRLRPNLRWGRLKHTYTQIFHLSQLPLVDTQSASVTILPLKKEASYPPNQCLIYLLEGALILRNEQEPFLLSNLFLFAFSDLFKNVSQFSVLASVKLSCLNPPVNSFPMRDRVAGSRSNFEIRTVKCIF